MRRIRGGMDFPAGRLTTISPPPPQLPAQPIVLRVDERPEVHAGQAIRQGQLLTQPVHMHLGCQISPVSGTVQRMEPIDGTDQPSATRRRRRFEIQIDPHGSSCEPFISFSPPRGRKLENWLAAMRQLGAWAGHDGGVGLLPQLAATVHHKVDTVILNGLDRFPPFPDASSLLASFPDEVAAGTRVIADLVGARQVMLVAARAARLSGRLRPTCRIHSVRLHIVNNHYPTADPTLLVWACTSGRRRLQPRTNPVSRGVVILDPWTAIRIGRWLTMEALDLARPYLLAWPERHAAMSACWALPGASLTVLHKRLAAAPPPLGERVVFGNLMSGQSAQEPGETAPRPLLAPEDEMLITYLGSHVPSRPPAEPCIACGWCAHVCPTALRPARLLELCASEDARLLAPYQLDWCVDCGLCSHVCPSALPLAQTFRQTMAHFAPTGQYVPR